MVNYGQQLLIETPDCLQPAVARGRKLKPVCGDHVRGQMDESGQMVIEAIEPRTSQLQRHDPRQGSRILAANVDVLFVVMATRPAPDLALVDRYLVAGEALGLQIELVFNKTDLLTAEARAQWAERLAIYTRIGYPLHWVSSKAQPGCALLADRLQGKCGIFVGPSGAGKSSMIRTLVPDHAPRTQALSEASGQGQHTTTATRLYRLPRSNGGSIIDSPGVRDFRIWDMPVADLVEHFREFRDYLGQCRFANCQHHREPGCRILEAVNAGQISPSRYESYQQLAEIMRQTPRY